MKKLSLILTVILTMIFSLLCFASCGTAGTYKFKSLSEGLVGFTKVYEVGDEYNGEELTADYFTLKLNDDGTAVIGEEGTTLTCDWTEEDGTIYFKQNGVTLYTATIDGREMTIKFGDTSLIGVEIVLEKAWF